MTESRATCKVVKSRDETLLSRDADPLPRSSRYRANPEEEGRVKIDRKVVKLRREFSLRYVKLRCSLSIESECNLSMSIT